MTHEDVALAVEEAMTPVERRRFLATFVALNPRWNGARVADILDELGNADANLAVIEPLYEHHRRDVPEPGLLGAAGLAAIYTYGLTTAEEVWPQAEQIINAVRVNERVAENRP